MNRLVVYPHAGTLVGGSTHSALLMSRFLREHGWYIVHVFPAPGPGADITAKEGFEIEFLNLPTQDILALRNTQGVVRKFCSLVPYLKTTFGAHRWLAEKRSALIHVNDDRSMLSWGLAAKCLGIPVIWHVRQCSGNPLMDRFRLCLADYIIYIAEDTKNRFKGIKRLPPGAVIYNPVDTERFQPAQDKAQAKLELGIRDDAVSIGYVGNFVARKRPEWLVEIVAELLREGLPVYGVIAGFDLSGGEYIARLKDMIEATGHPDRFVFLGYRPDVARVMQGLDILLLPSIAEPFGRVVIEAMACEVAVVATNAGGVPEIIQDGKNGLLTSPEDVTEMIEKVKDLCTNSDKRESLSKQARMYVVEKFAPEVTLGTLLEIYTSLTGES